MPTARRHRALNPALLAVLLASALCLGAAAPRTAAASPAAEVDPFIGTGTGPGGSINLFPGPSLPFGMVQLSPDTEARGYGYHYADPDIQGFSMTHMSGPGCDNEGDVFFTATTGAVHTQIANFESPYNHAEESANPGSYQVTLTRWHTHVALTATLHTGEARFTFPAGKRANVLVPISHTLDHTAGAQVHVVSHSEITGYVEDHCFCGSAATYKVYFDMRFSQPFASFGTWNGPLGAAATLSAGSRSAEQTNHQQWIGAYASWPSSPQARTVTVRVGISYVDAAGAAGNLRAEALGKSFAQLREAAGDAWNHDLGVIRVAGGSATERRVFYTALYHSLLMPSEFNDADGRYLGFDGQVHQAEPGHAVYANYSGWDIYRSEMPLLALIAPHRFEDMCESVVLMYQQGGWIDRWPQINHYTNVMAGSPLTTGLAMAWLDGLHGFNMQAAWQGMVKDATTAPPKGAPYQGEVSMDWINQVHYVPNDKQSYGSVSQLQEDAVAYASLYDLAKARGDAAAAKEFYDRALYVRNLFDAADGYFRPKNADGAWTPNFDPSRQGGAGAVYRQVRKMAPARRKKMMAALLALRDKSPARRAEYLASTPVRTGYTAAERKLLRQAVRLMTPTGFIEGSGWHYQWLDPEDMSWLIGAVGRDRFNRRLEAFFDYAQPGWHGQLYNPYNETDLEAPFEFDFSGMPWETQRVVRKVLSQNYTTSVNGVPGNDDCGEMSSWAVMSMMGIYTVDPASTAYELVSPVFSRVTIRLHAPYAGKQFVIAASPDPAASPYIQSVTVNGRPLQRDWIWYRQITNGGEMQVTLGARPNRTWGSAPADAPPSLSQEKP